MTQIPCPLCGGDCTDRQADNLSLGVTDDLDTGEPLVVIALFLKGEVLGHRGLGLAVARELAAAILDAVKVSEALHQEDHDARNMRRH